MSQLRAGAPVEQTAPVTPVRYAGVPMRVAQAWARMSPRLRELARLCDGHRTVNEICAVSDIGANQTHLALLAMARAGLIVDANDLVPRARPQSLSTWLVPSPHNEPAAPTTEAAGPLQRLAARTKERERGIERRAADGKAPAAVENTEFSPEEEAFFSTEMPEEMDPDDPRLK